MTGPDFKRRYYNYHERRLREVQSWSSWREMSPAPRLEFAWKRLRWITRREATVFALRMAGWTFARLGDHEAVTGNRAWQIVQKTMWKLARQRRGRLILRYYGLEEATGRPRLC